MKTAPPNPNELIVVVPVDVVTFTNARGISVRVQIANEGPGYDRLVVEYTREGLGHWVMGHDEDFDFS